MVVQYVGTDSEIYTRKCVGGEKKGNFAYGRRTTSPYIAMKWIPLKNLRPRFVVTISFLNAQLKRDANMLNKRAIYLIVKSVYFINANALATAIACHLIVHFVQRSCRYYV